MLRTFKEKNRYKKLLNLEILFPSIVLVVFFLTEFISKVLKISHFDFDRVSGVFKFIFEIFILFYLYKRKKDSWNKLLRIVIPFLVIYIFGQWFLNQGDFFRRLLLNLYSLNGYLFLFILYYSLKPNCDSEEQVLNEQLAWLNRTIKAIFILNSLTIVIGLLFGLNLFKTYLGFSDRFGFSGMFLFTSHSSYIHIIFILYFFCKYVAIKNNANLLFFVGAVSISMLTGTKTVYFFNILFLTYLFIKSFKPYISTFVGLLIGTLVILNYSTLVLNFQEKFKVLSDVYENYGALTMLFSTRNLAVTNDFIPYVSNNWSFFNYLIGGAEFNIARTEIELIDCFWFFGLLGGFVYLRHFYIKFLVPLWENTALRIPLMFLLISITLSGSFFTNAPVIPYFIIFFYSVKNKFKFL